MPETQKQQRATPAVERLVGMMNKSHDAVRQAYGDEKFHAMLQEPAEQFAQVHRNGGNMTQVLYSGMRSAADATTKVLLLACYREAMDILIAAGCTPNTTRAHVS